MKWCDGFSDSDSGGLITCDSCAFVWNTEVADAPFGTWPYKHETFARRNGSYKHPFTPYPQNWRSLLTLMRQELSVHDNRKLTTLIDALDITLQHSEARSSKR